MTKTDTQLTDYLGACLRIDLRDFTTSYFHVAAVARLYKQYGDTFLIQLRKRAGYED
jgi:hypothetical protein